MQDMHLRIATVRCGDRTYRYAQFVESYRRPDGMPAHRMVASLGRRSDLEIDNLRLALRASRDGARLVLPDAAGKLPEVAANLRYLDVAMVLRIWQELGLDALLRDILVPGETQVPVEAVVAALVVHRCVAPDSKLAARRWYPTTALPVLQGIPGRSFNNTRIHRALVALEKVEDGLKDALPRHLRAREGGFVALFGDITDTWFVGRGPAMAQKGRTKEGLFRRRIGIALLCDPRGYPVKWQTLPGRYQEAPVMEDMLGQLVGLDWVGDTPVVVDRAMGRAGSIEALVDSGLRFLTALPVDEFASYTSRIPWQAFAGVDDPDEAGALQALDRIAREVGFVRVRSDRYVMDLGVFEKGEGDARKGRRHREDGPSQAVAAIRLARDLAADLSAAPRSRMALAAERHVGVGTVTQHLRLLALAPALQERVLAGEVDAATVGMLITVADRPIDEQPAAFERLRRELAGRSRRRAHPARRPVQPPIRLRGVLHFNPERFVERRRTAQAQLVEIAELARTLDEHLGRAGSRRSAAAVLRDIDTALRRNKVTELFTVTVAEEQGRATRVTIEPDPQAWAERHRYDGFNLFVAHPALEQDPAAIVALYFAKDAVEKDFQTIKSVIDLHPIRHRTNPKVRAHVTLCVLALLVERVLEDRLRDANLPLSAPAALETLAPCHLNEFGSADAPAYQLTRRTTEQAALLAALQLQELTDPTHLAKLTAR